MDKKGFYAQLDLKPGSSIDEIKRAYNKKVMKYHPDIGSAMKKLHSMPDGPEKQKKKKEIEDEMRLLNDAKSVLTDENKKKMYDQGIDENSHQGGFDMGDIFDMMGGRAKQRGQKKVQDTEFKVSFTLKDSYTGRKKTFNVRRDVICDGCSGKGGEQYTICNTCRGTGECEVKVQMGFMFTVSTEKCKSCLGSCYTKKGPVCGKCKGQRYINKSESISVEFKKGFSDGETIVVKGKGDEYVGAIPGDLVLVANVAKSNDFRRQGNHLIMKADVDLNLALLGGTLSVKHIDDSILNVQVTKINNLREDFIVIQGAGFQGGNLYIEPQYDTKNIDLKQLKVKSNPTQGGINCKGVIGKVPVEQRRQQQQGRGGFKESIFEQFFSGF